MKAFEIHTFHNGRWKIDSVFDDSDLAVLEARRLNDGKAQLGVRVVEEEFDEQSRRTMARTIFHSSNVGDPGRTRRRDQPPAAAAEPARRSATIPTASEPSSGPLSTSASGGHSRLIPKLTVVLVLTVAAFFGIQSLITAS